MFQISLLNDKSKDKHYTMAVLLGRVAHNITSWLCCLVMLLITLHHSLSTTYISLGYRKEEKGNIYVNIIKIIGGGGGGSVY